jgi:hypothetical protein
MKTDPVLPARLGPTRKLASATGRGAASDNFLANRARTGGAITSTAGKRPPKRF